MASRMDGIISFAIKIIAKYLGSEHVAQIKTYFIINIITGNFNSALKS